MSIVDLLSKNEAKRRKAVEDIKNKLGEVEKNSLSPFLVGGDLTKLGEQNTAGKIATISSLMNPLTYLRTGASQLKDVNTMADLALTTTAPYRKGANILAQNYASAFTGKDMSQSDNQGAFLKYLAGAITPEEQKQILDKPFLEAVKSSAGMTSTLMPFTKIGSIANVGVKVVNPTISKLAQLATRGGIEGTVGGFGYSRPGKEIQDTLLGTAIGAGGEVLGGLVSDPTFRKGMGREFIKANSGKYKAMLDLGDNSSEVLYHQSQSKEPFKEFLQKGDPGYKKAGYSQAGEGIYFSPDKNLVQSKYGQSGGQLIEARINSKKKLDLGNYDAMYFDGRKVNYGDIVNENFKREIQGINKLPEPDILLTNISKKAKSWLVKNGYDTVEGMKGEMWSAPETVVLDKSIIKILPQVEKVSSNIIKLANAEDIPNTYSNMLKKISQNSNGRQANFARVMDEALSEGNRGERFISTENIPETPKVSMGLGGKKTYSKQAMLAKRSKTAKRIPISSWNADILEELKSKRK